MTREMKRDLRIVARAVVSLAVGGACAAATWRAHGWADALVVFVVLGLLFDIRNEARARSKD